MTFGDEKAGSEARRRREEALRALSDDSSTQTRHEHEERRPLLATTLTPPPRRRPRWLTPAISGFVSLAALALIVAHFWSPSPARHAPATLALDPKTIGITCLAGAAWSPDGSKLAVLGSRQGCNTPQVDSGTIFSDVVALVDPASGRSVGQVSPDGDVQKALSAAGYASQQAILYSGVMWSPDGKRLALPFAVYYPSAQSGTSGVDIVVGLCVIASDGSESHTYLVPIADTSKFTGEWDLKTGKPMMRASIPSNQVIAVGQSTLTPAALRYTWQSDGSLAGSGMLNATSAPAPSPLVPVGNPDGGASFTVWQPMQITQNTGDPMQKVSPAPFVVYSTFLAWSPDGAYLVNALLGPWRIQPSKQPIPGPDQLKASFTARLPLLPVRDAALDAAMNMLTSKQSITSNGGFAWSPDGRMLSAFKQVNGDTTILTILDCASAKTLATITLHGASSASANNGNGGILWAPDGKRLLVESGPELFILESGELPVE